MSISFQCDHCGQSYTVRDEFAGRRLKCKICKEPIAVPAPAEEIADDLLAEEVEESPAGGPILRHAPRDREFELAIGDSESIEQISSHIEQYIGPIAMVFHEPISDLVHVDVHHVAADASRPFHTLITSGMSDLPMTVPPGAEAFQHAELVLRLPANWPMAQESWNDENNYWPIRSLKFLARFPHEYQTWLGYGHTIPNGDPPERFAENTKLCCWSLALVLGMPEGFHQLTLADGRVVNFYSLLALHREEIDFKLKHGMEALLDKFDAARQSDVLDVRRKSVVKRGWFS